MTRRPERLLPGPSAELVDGLARLEGLLAQAFPLRPKHRAALPGGVARLSALLTTDRDDLPRDYLARPEHLAAYLHWFLPWNLYRQGRLLAGLPLDLAAGARLVDLGAGPLTFLLALWLARPDLRGLPLRYEGVDRAEPALRAGRDLFAALAGPEGAAWEIATRRGAAGPHTGPGADLVVAANLLNELEPERGGRRRGPDVQEHERLVLGWERMVAPGGRLLLIEPGVRPAAAQLVRLRSAALERGWRVEAPCTHAETCPLPGRRGGAWCHFACDTAGAPRWLEALGRAAKLPKERASLSFLLLQAGGDMPAAGARFRVRVVSDVFDLPAGRRGCYACGEAGLVLLTLPLRDAEFLPASGDALAVTVPEGAARDGRSGAVVVALGRPRR
ncbi:MAG: small ribosomal subunit Rsm22 family protein [Candidatus Krumholzibacteriia bacterium]